ncbi:MAG TPA: T9SS type A sorting domain-containing protein [Ignavibacteriales bacterium]|nr:T9SS type A sorting domain-containing protein [Ignavibacteriales bacterium]
MKKVTLMLFTLFVVSAFYSQINAQILLDENFDYKVGAKLDTLGWTNHSGTGTFLTVLDSNLTYANYPLVSKGGEVVLEGGSGSREDVNHPIEKHAAGTLYASFLIKVASATTGGDYFFHYKWNGTGGIFLARTYVKDNGSGKFVLGLSKSGTAVKYTTDTYDYNTTYLVVVKYEYVGDAAGLDDKVSLYVNPDITTTEPASAQLTDVETGTKATDAPIDAIALRQGSGVYKLMLDGVRVATSWDELKGDLVAPVTFQADMRVQILEQKFTVGTNKVVLRGDFQSVAGDAGGNWQGTKFELQDPDKDSIYTLTLDFPVSKVDTNYAYKLVLAPDSWESADNRPFAPKLPNKILAPVYFSNDTVANIPSPYIGKTYHFTFTADVSAIYGTGDGFFDPSRDSLLVMGLDWEGGTNVQGERKMHETLTAGVFTTELSVKATGDSTKWKFHAYPESHFSNAGWEAGNDNWFVYGKDTVVTLGHVPRITPSAPALTKDQPVLFQVDMHNAKNAYDSTAINLNDIYFVGVKGADSTIGAWAGSWVVADTASTPKTIIVLNDKGILGDKVAGDGIWSKLITFKAGTHGGAVEYKFACWYKDADKHTTNTAVLDNEGGFGKNHSFVLKETAGTINLKNDFGNMTTDVKQVKTNQVPTVYSLDQNYPNPFNPATTIRYSVPKAGMVTLKIYNMLGQEVATLINAQQNAGKYEVSFDASRLSSGIYLYNLTSGSFSSTKKMMLVK